MPRLLIWDAPTRILHAALAIGFLAAFAIAQFGGEHGPFFDYHALLGIALAAVLLLRLLWALLGTRHARFSSLALSPSRLVDYFRGVLAGKPRPYDGHNPATSWAALLMFALLAAIITTGLLMGTGIEALKKLHSLAVYALLIVIAAHVAGVLLHSLQTREFLVAAMVDGRKHASPDAALPSARPFLGALTALAILAIAAALVYNYDSAAHHTHLPLTGTTLQLAESGDHGQTDHGQTTPRRHEDDD